MDGIIYIPVVNIEEAMRVLAYAHGSLSIDDNHINKKSSRSHSVFGLVLLNVDDLSWGQFAFLDKAGTEGREPNERSQLSEKVTKEADKIKKSLLALHTMLTNKLNNQQTQLNVKDSYRGGPLVQYMACFFENPGTVNHIVSLSPFNKYSTLKEVLATAAMAKEIALPEATNKNASI